MYMFDKIVYLPFQKSMKAQHDKSFISSSLIIVHIHKLIVSNICEKDAALIGNSSAQMSISEFLVTGNFYLPVANHKTALPFHDNWTCITNSSNDILTTYNCI